MSRITETAADNRLEALIASWSEQLRAGGVDSSLLDEIVHDVFDDSGVLAANDVPEDSAEAMLDVASRRAADVNNRLLEDQIMVLVLYHGIDAARTAIFNATSVLVGVIVH